MGVRLVGGMMLWILATVLCAVEDADGALRFVNGEVITRSDLWQKIQEKLQTMQMRGLPPPTSQEDAEALQSESLEEETDELLLMQESKRLNATIDSQTIRRRVQDWARENNLTLTLEQEMQERERRYKGAILGGVVYHYRGMWPSPSPEQIAAAYEERAEEFARPPRVKVHRILMAASTPTIVKAIHNRMFTMMQAIQVSEDENIQGTVTEELLGKVIDADAEERPKIISLIIADAIKAAPAEPEGATKRLVAQLQETLAEYRALRTPEQVNEQLTALREEMLAIKDPSKRIEAFAAAAANLGTGEGHDPEAWLEPGTWEEEANKQAFALNEPGEISPQFTDGLFQALLCCIEKDNSTIRSLEEVVAELEASIEEEQAAAAEAELLRQLRAKATIVDVDGALDLPVGWESHSTQPAEENPQ